MKKLNSLLLSLIMIILPFITNIELVSASILQYGDTNEDGDINITDTAAYIGIVNGAGSPLQKRIVDMNYNGKVDIEDYNLILGITEGTTKEIEFNNKIKEDNEIKEGTYEPDYDETCVAGYGQVEKCIVGYTFSNSRGEDGLYLLQGDSSRTENGDAVYYFKGNIENNYVYFGTHKKDVVNTIGDPDDVLSHNEEVVAHAGDPILWRIVRINEDGSIRLISEYNTSKRLTVIWSMSGIVRYINEDETKSDIKDTVDNWYNENIKVDKNVDNLVLTGKFCNDISGNYEAAKKRYEDNNPILICPEEGLVINEKAGLITIDELTLAKTNKRSGKNSYFYNYLNFWTLSPYRKDLAYWVTITNNTSMTNTKDGDPGARPVINLNADTVMLGGTGTKEKPYIIKTYTNRAVIMNTVNASTENIITSDKLNNAKENKTTLEYETYNTHDDNGKYLYTWKIDADNITTAKDINTVIDINTLKETDNQTYSKIKTVIKKDDADVKYLTFTEDGNIGSKATVTVDVSDMGSNVSVYKWDSSTNTILAVNPNQTIEDGKVSFDVSDNTNTKNYFITKGVLSESIVGNPNTGMMIFYIIGGISVLLIAGITYLIYSKKNNKFLKA